MSAITLSPLTLTSTANTERTARTDWSLPVAVVAACVLVAVLSLLACWMAKKRCMSRSRQSVSTSYMPVCWNVRMSFDRQRRAGQRSRDGSRQLLAAPLH